MKELPYFKFYCSEWINGNITLESLESQGLFVNICVWYWSRECNVNYDILVKKFRYNQDLIDDLLNSELIKNQNGKIKIDFLDEQLKERRKIAKRNKTNGLKGGRPKTQWVSNGLAKNNPNITNKEEKRREEIKEVKEKINTDYFCPSYVPIELWQAFMEVRKAKKAAQTERALKTLINQLGKLEADTPGWANEEINASVVNSWKGIFPDEKRKPKATKRSWY